LVLTRVGEAKRGRGEGKNQKKKKGGDERGVGYRKQMGEGEKKKKKYLGNLQRGRRSWVDWKEGNIKSKNGKEK